MIQKETYLLDNIQRIKDKYNLDPELIQRAIFALGFSCRNMPFIKILLSLC